MNIPMTVPLLGATPPPPPPLPKLSVGWNERQFTTQEEVNDWAKQFASPVTLTMMGGSRVVVQVFGGMTKLEQFSLEMMGGFVGALGKNAVMELLAEPKGLRPLTSLAVHAAKALQLAIEEADEHAQRTADPAPASPA